MGRLAKSIMFAGSFPAKSSHGNSFIKSSNFKTVECPRHAKKSDSRSVLARKHQPSLSLSASMDETGPGSRVPYNASAQKETPAKLPATAPPVHENPMLSWTASYGLSFKRILIWMFVLVIVYMLRPFFPVLFGTFVIAYVANSVVAWIRTLSDNRVPRRLSLGLFYACIIAFLTTFSLISIPRAFREGQDFVYSLQSSNPYVLVADGVRSTLGDELAEKLESFVTLSMESPASSEGKPNPQMQEVLDHIPSSFAGTRKSPTSTKVKIMLPKPSSSSSPISGSTRVSPGGEYLESDSDSTGSKRFIFWGESSGKHMEAPSSKSNQGQKIVTSPKSSIQSKDAKTNPNPPTQSNSASSSKWTEERSRRLGMLLQKAARGKVSQGARLVMHFLTTITKTVYTFLASLLFSFMIMWDLPTITKKVRRLRNSRLSDVYLEVAPALADFGLVVGKSFEAQAAVALVNTVLTTAGLLFLQIPGVFFLTTLVLACSFIPVAGVFLSTLPMMFVALSEHGMSKALSVALMVLGVHFVEAYILNPQIYSSHLKLHPLFVLVVLYISEHSFGIFGLLLAVPIAVYLLRFLKMPESDVESEQPKQAQTS